jgi:endoglucanase
MEGVLESAQALGLPHQEYAFNGASYATDAVGAMFAGNGMATVTLACPRRYSHSPVEIFSKKDVAAFQQVTESFIRKDVELKMF